MDEEKILEDIARSTEVALIPTGNNILVLETKHKQIGVQGHEIIYRIKVSKKTNVDVGEKLTQENSQDVGAQVVPERQRIFREIAMAESSPIDMDDMFMSEIEFMKLKDSSYKRPSYASAMRKFLESLHSPMFVENTAKITKNKRAGRPNFTKNVTLENALSNKDLSQFLPKYLRGGVEFLNTSIVNNFDRPGLYKVSVKFNLISDFPIRTNKEKSMISSKDQIVDAETIETTDEPTDFGTVYRPDKLSHLSSLSQFLKSYQKPILFSVDSLENIVHIGNEKILKLPPKILYDCNINGNFFDTSLSEFKGYWSIKPEGDFEMVLMPLQNADMLDEDTKKFLQKIYENKTGIMHYQNGLNLSDLPISENSEVAILADNSPFAIIKIDKKYLNKVSGLSSSIVDYDLQEVLEMIQKKETPYIGKRQLKAYMWKLRAKESMIREFPGTAKIVRSSYYSDMFKFDVNKDRIVTSNISPPREILKQYLGVEAYDKLGNGVQVKDFVMRYHLTNEAFDIALIPKPNLVLLMNDKNSSGEFLEYFNNEFYTLIRAYGEPSKKVCFISMPSFAKDSGIRLQFLAKNDFYVNIKQLDV